MDQMTLDMPVTGDLQQIDRVLSVIRPKIDFLLGLFNLLPRHVAYGTLSAVGEDIGRSISLCINSAAGIGGEIVLRLRHQARCDFIEFPENRLRFYRSLGECRTVGASSGCYRFDLIGEPDCDGIGQAVFEDLTDRLLSLPSDFGCCGKYEECSNALHCINLNPDVAALCGYKKNLMRGRIFYGKYAGRTFPANWLPEDYVVLDLETTDRYPTTAQIVEISACKVHRGEIVDWFDSMVNPLCHIPAEASEKNHIYDSDVADAPCFCEIADELAAFLGDLPLVGHNIDRFDRHVLENHFDRELDNPIIDTLALSRKLFNGFPSHKLDYLNQVFCLSMNPAHRAHADVLTTKRLLSVFENLFLYVSILGTLPAAEETPSREKSHKYHHATIPSPQNPPDESSPLFGKVVVFTGELSCTRAEAMQAAVDRGMIVKTSVTKKTNYLVCGEQDPSLVGDDMLSTKQERAIELNAQGCNIVSLSESEFFEMLSEAK